MATCPLCGGSRELPGVAVIPERSAIFIDGRPIHLEHQVAEVALALLKAMPQLRSRERLMFALYGNDVNGGPETDKMIDVAIVKLRRAIKGTRVRIVTIWGQGFYMEIGDKAWADEGRIHNGNRGGRRKTVLAAKAHQRVARDVETWQRAGNAGERVLARIKAAMEERQRIEATRRAKAMLEGI